MNKKQKATDIPRRIEALSEQRPFFTPNISSFLKGGEEALGWQAGRRRNEWWNEFVGVLRGRNVYSRYTYLRSLLVALRERVETERDEELRDWIRMRERVLDSVLRRYELFGRADTWEEMSPQEQEEVELDDPLYVIGEALQAREERGEQPFSGITHLTKWAEKLPRVYLAYRAVQGRFERAGIYETGGNAAKGKQAPAKIEQLQRALIEYYKGENADGDSA